MRDEASSACGGAVASALAILESCNKLDMGKPEAKSIPRTIIATVALIRMRIPANSGGEC